jgi:hypothetical protein
MSRRMMINFNKLCLLVLLVTVVYNEFLCFYLSYLSWPRLPPTDDVTASAVLFIADPQIQGSLHEPPGISNPATTF